MQGKNPLLTSHAPSRPDIRMLPYQAGEPLPVRHQQGWNLYVIPVFFYVFFRNAYGFHAIWGIKFRSEYIHGPLVCFTSYLFV